LNSTFLLKVCLNFFNGKPEIKGICFNIIKAIYNKLAAIVIVNWKKLKPFPPKPGLKQKCPLFLLLFNIVLEFLARAKQQKKDIKGFQ
jgi:hypothetical protein